MISAGVSRSEKRMYNFVDLKHFILSGDIIRPIWWH